MFKIDYLFRFWLICPFSCCVLSPLSVYLQYIYISFIVLIIAPPFLTSVLIDVPAGDHHWQHVHHEAVGARARRRHAAGEARRRGRDSPRCAERHPRCSRKWTIQQLKLTPTHTHTHHTCTTHISRLRSTRFRSSAATHTYTRTLAHSRPRTRKHPRIIE